VRAAIVIATLVAAACADPPERALLPTAPGDLAAGGLVVPTEDAPPAASRIALSRAWSIDARTDLAARAPVHVETSRAFWQEVDTAGLREGFALGTSVAGAAVAIQPLDGDARSGAGLDPATIDLFAPDGTMHAAGEGFVHGADADTVRKAGVGLPSGTTAFVLDPALGAGAFVLRTDAAPAGTSWLVWVRERDSTVAMRVRTDASAYVYGDRVEIEVELAHDGAPLDAKSIEARIRPPRSAAIEVTMTPTLPGRWQGALELVDDVPPAGAAWIVEVTADYELPGGVQSHRSARTAFGYAVPTARFAGPARVDAGFGDSMVAALPIEVAAAGRYAVGGVVWGTAPDGTMRPALALQSADWLEPGDATIALELAGASLAAAGLGAPLQLRDLHLLDQGRVAVLHRQALALAIDELPWQ
jgi:hypothetical protein